MLEKIKKVHLIGIGGIGVSAVARLLHADGYQVQGSDVRESSITEALRREGIRVMIGHDPSHVEGMELVVVSTAIPDHNPELVAAREAGLAVMHRSMVLNELIGSRTVIGVTGTHGKGTVSSMIAWILEVSGWDPGFVIGGYLNNFGTNARGGGGKWMVVEVDESDGSHLNYDLDYVVCNFLEVDHLNYYTDLEDMITKMRGCFNESGRLKRVFVNRDCEGNRKMVEGLDVSWVGYGMLEGADVKGELEGLGQFPTRFHVRTGRGRERGDLCSSDAKEWSTLFELNLPGRYNAGNALAAIAVAYEIGVPLESCREALRSYKGLENRFTLVQAGPYQIVKDYISHPTGMRRVIESARDLSKGRLFGVFKPYRYTLIHYLKDEYGASFEGCHEVVISKMYAADEDPIPGVDTMTIVDRIRENGISVRYIEDQEEITDYLESVIEPGDQVIFFGGDDYFQMADRWVKRLESRSASMDKG